MKLVCSGQITSLAVAIMRILVLNIPDWPYRLYMHALNALSDCISYVPNLGISIDKFVAAAFPYAYINTFQSESTAFLGVLWAPGAPRARRGKLLTNR